MNTSLPNHGQHTYTEILQQPSLWPDTVERVRNCQFRCELQTAKVVVTGAGTSAYAAEAVEAAWPVTGGGEARAIPSTDLLVDSTAVLAHRDTLLSLGRSGDSPESLGAIQRVQKLQPAIRHFAITCNSDGALAQRLGDQALILDPRSNDRSLVMTSSFSNLVLAGICLRNFERMRADVTRIAERVDQSFGEMEGHAERVARNDPSRAVVLTSRTMIGAGQEAALKLIETTGGRIAVIAETFLGLRHGRMSFLRPDTLVLCWLSNDAVRRSYEEDLLAELRNKKLGWIVCIASPPANPEIADLALPASAPHLPDSFRTPFEIVFAQLVAYYMGLRAGLDPDSPSRAILK